MALGREGSWTCGRVGATKRDGRGAMLVSCECVSCRHAACRRRRAARQGKARQGRAGQGPGGGSGAFAAWDEGEEEDRDGA